MEETANSDRIRTISRHTLSYILCSISELFRQYNFDPLDLLIVHAVLNSNVLNVMKDRDLDERFSSIHTIEPDEVKVGVSRVVLSRFLNLPLETVRRRVTGLKKQGVFYETTDGLFVSQDNQFGFGNNHHLQRTNILLLRKLLRDLERAGVGSANEL